MLVFSNGFQILLQDDLSASQKEEFKALNLRAAKLAEIEATNKQKELTETALANF